MTDKAPEKLRSGVRPLPAALREALHKLAGELYMLVNVTSVVLYGSYSKGTYGKNSDVDIAVFVLPGTAEVLKRTFHSAQTLANCVSDYDIQIRVFDGDSLAEPVGIIEEIVMYGKEIGTL